MLPALLAVFATFLATLLLLLVSLSVPIIKSVDLFDLSIAYRSGSITNSSIDAVVEFGVWGYCRSAIEASYVRIVCSSSGFLTPVRLLLACLGQAPRRNRPVPLPSLAINSIPPPRVLCMSDVFFPVRPGIHVSYAPQVNLATSLTSSQRR